MFWLCRCECGKEKEIYQYSLTSGATKSCGCLAAKFSSLRNRENLVGKKFGRLTVIRDSGRRQNRNIVWECLCNCGKRSFHKTSNLTRGVSTSCGCYHRQQLIARQQIWDSKSDALKAPVSVGSSYFARIPQTDSPEESSSGLIMVSCKGCGVHFIPTRTEIGGRIRAFEGRASGATEMNFYCSDKCKISCPVFGAKTTQPDPRLRMPLTKSQAVRSCQTKALKQIQCDHNDGQSFCEKCGDFIDVELHHTLPVSEFGLDAIAPSGHILLCAGCHTSIHAGCK